jgi:hypothetical protein
MDADRVGRPPGVLRRNAASVSRSVFNPDRGSGFARMYPGARAQLPLVAGKRLFPV